MFKKLKNIICLSMAVFAPLSLMAAAKDTTTSEDGSFDNNGFYVGVNAGAGYIPSGDYKFSGPWEAKPVSKTSGLFDVVISIDNNSIKNKGTYDFIGSSFIGYMMSNFQFEIEGGMTMSPKLKVKSTTIEGFNFINNALVPSNESIVGNTIGKEKIFFGLINGYFNIDMGRLITPYIGFGAGIAQYKIIFSDNAFNKNFNVKVHQKDDLTHVQTAGLTYVMEDDMKKNALILHGAAGASMKINDKVIIGAGYKFIGSFGEIELGMASPDSNDYKTVLAAPGGSYKVSGKIKHQFMRHIGIINAKMLL